MGLCHEGQKETANSDAMSANKFDSDSQLAIAFQPWRGILKFCFYVHVNDTILLLLTCEYQVNNAFTNT